MNSSTGEAVWTPPQPIIHQVVEGEGAAVQWEEVPVEVQVERASGGEEGEPTVLSPGTASADGVPSTASAAGGTADEDSVAYTTAQHRVRTKLAAVLASAAPLRGHDNDNGEAGGVGGGKNDGGGDCLATVRDWEVYESQEGSTAGHLYYYFPSSGHTTWRPPAELLDASDAEWAAAAAPDHIGTAESTTTTASVPSGCSAVASLSLLSVVETNAGTVVATGPAPRVARLNLLALSMEPRGPAVGAASSSTMVPPIVGEVNLHPGPLLGGGAAARHARRSVGALVHAAAATVTAASAAATAEEVVLGAVITNSSELSNVDGSLVAPSQPPAVAAVGPHPSALKQRRRSVAQLNPVAPDVVDFSTSTEPTPPAGPALFNLGLRLPTTLLAAHVEEARRQQQRSQQTATTGVATAAITTTPEALSSRGGAGTARRPSITSYAVWNPAAAGASSEGVLGRRLAASTAQAAIGAASAMATGAAGGGGPPSVSGTTSAADTVVGAVPSTASPPTTTMPASSSAHEVAAPSSSRSITSRTPLSSTRGGTSINTNNNHSGSSGSSAAGSGGGAGSSSASAEAVALALGTEYDRLVRMRPQSRDSLAAATATDGADCSDLAVPQTAAAAVATAAAARALVKTVAPADVTASPAAADVAVSLPAADISASEAAATVPASLPALSTHSTSGHSAFIFPPSSPTSPTASSAAVPTAPLPSRVAGGASPHTRGAGPGAVATWQRGTGFYMGYQRSGNGPAGSFSTPAAGTFTASGSGAGQQFARQAGGGSRAAATFVVVAPHLAHAEDSQFVDGLLVRALSLAHQPPPPPSASVSYSAAAAGGDPSSGLQLLDLDEEDEVDAVPRQPIVPAWLRAPAAPRLPPSSLAQTALSATAGVTTSSAAGVGYGSSQGWPQETDHVHAYAEDSSYNDATQTGRWWGGEGTWGGDAGGASSRTSRSTTRSGRPPPPPAPPPARTVTTTTTDATAPGFSGSTDPRRRASGHVHVGDSGGIAKGAAWGGGEAEVEEAQDRMDRAAAIRTHESKRRASIIAHQQPAQVQPQQRREVGVKASHGVQQWG